MTYTNKTIALLSVLLLSQCAYSALSNDTEALLGSNTEPLDPKVLFIYDNSGSMDADDVPDDGGTIHRSTAAKRAVLDIIFATENDHIDFGLMGFNRNNSGDSDGGRVVFRVQDMTDANRGVNKPVVNDDNNATCTTTPTAGTISRALCDLRAETNTPLAETMYEGYRYFRGLSVDLGDENGTNVPPAKDSTAESSGTYLSPFYNTNTGTTLIKERDGVAGITANDVTCEQAYMIVMTDGVPTVDTNKDTAIANLLTTTVSPADPIIAGYPTGLITDVILNNNNNGGNSNFDRNSRLDDLAEFMFEVDMDGDSSNDVQRIMTYTIGLNINENLLNKTSLRGGSGGTGVGYFTASNSDQLADSLNALFASINASSATYTTPGVGGSVANDARSLNYIYYSFFTPEDSPRWNGNLKKYRLGEDSNGDLQVQDSSNRAVFNSQGEIKSTVKGDAYNVRSLWSNVDDSDLVSSGGAGASITDWTTSGRTVKTNIGSSLVSFEDSTAIRAVVPGSTNTEKTALINWARGQDPDDTSATRWVMGDPLHSAPAVINYGKRENSSAYAGDYSDIRVLIGTNAGFLHMFKDDLGGVSNTCSGSKSNSICFGYTTNDTVSESWAFIPREITHILDDLKSNTAAEPHPYGVDGTVGVYIYDKNQDGNICTGTNDCNSNGETDDDDDKVIAVFGLRRGVDSGNVGYYYALDITNPDSPSFLWKYGHSMMEQSWGTPQFGNVKYFDGSAVVTKAVAIFSAGYDSSKDVVDTLGTTDDKGRGIFMVDVTTGTLVWSLLGGSGTNTATAHYESSMLDSMPADAKVLDVDGDSYLDRIYIPDLGGQVWRIDLFNSDAQNKEDNSEPNTTDSRLEWTVHKVASLGRHTTSSTVNENDRRFFNQVDYIQTRDDTGNFDALIIGSGHRNNPNEQNVNNRIYMIKDENISTYKFQSTACSTTSGSDAACRLNPSVKTNSSLTDVTTTALSTASSNGWRLDLYTTSSDGADEVHGNADDEISDITREKNLGSSVTINGVVY
ncbi:MAG: hypothetical protein GY694_13265, partial [Gammaproteobacteria bacterium]|nr:hypothetical protein [Gammaproteobacteria bacterium]